VPAGERGEAGNDFRAALDAVAQRPEDRLHVENGRWKPPQLCLLRSLLVCTVGMEAKNSSGVLERGFQWGKRIGDEIDRIVDLVGDARGKPANRGHFLCMD